MFNLTEELMKYRPFDDKEKRDVEITLSFLKENNNCFDRSNLKGHVTAGAFIADKKGNILLNHHKKSNMWFQFGGHCDGESDCLNVAKREVLEETGLEDFTITSNSIFDVGIVHIPDNAKRSEPEHLHYDINFLFIVDAHNYVISNESLDIKWVTIDKVLKLVNKDDYSMLRMIKKYKYLLDKKILSSSDELIWQV